MAFSLFLPDIARPFLSGWNDRTSSMYLLLICISVTISFSVNSKMPSESLRFVFTPSGLHVHLLIFVGRGREVNHLGYVVVGASFFGRGVDYFLG